MLYKHPQLELIWRDGSGSRGITNAWIRAGASRDQAAAAALQLVDFAEPVSDAIVVGFRSLYAAVEEPRPLAPGDSPAAAAALLVFSTTEPDQLATITIPALRPALLQASGAGAGRLINTDDPAVQALITALTNALYCNPFAYQLTALEAAYLQVLP